MSILGAWLFAVGIGDLIRGISGDVGGWLEARLAPLVGSFAGAVLLAAAGYTPAVIWPFFLAVVIALALWGSLRSIEGPHQAMWALGSLLFFLGTCALLILAAPYLPTPRSESLMEHWLEAGVYRSLSTRSAPEVTLILGISTVLLATGNALVRSLLVTCDIQIQRRDPQRLKGGRIIGPMERLLIFGFVLAGAPESAALIVAAKSLLRFPEVNRSETPMGPGDDGVADLAAGAPQAGPSVAALSEYFLVGSLSSWLIALAPILLLGTTS